MRCKTSFWFLLCVLIFALSSCEKINDDSEPLPTISEVPSIQLQSVSASSVKQFEDSLVFYISFLDGDGDIGFADADSMSLHITDNRFPLTHQYHVPPFAPQGTSPAIQGTLRVVLKNIIMKNSSSTQETATFTVKLRDRANNWSNEAVSQQVVITP